MLAAGAGFDAVVLADGLVTDIPALALRQLVAAGKPVVGVNVQAEDGSDRNESSFLYHQDAFKRLYRAARKSGIVSAGAQRGPFSLQFFRYLNIAPLTCVGADLLLVRRAVVDAGVRFAAEPYKYHGDAEGFAIAARDEGFEVCALPNVVVTTSRPTRIG
jgi:hypothetical protein